jgi:hypothetical protein
MMLLGNEKMLLMVVAHLEAQRLV